MSTFNDAIDQLVSILLADANLKAFCREKWGKSLKVETVFKSRVEINQSDLPIILITRPETEKSYLVSNVRDSKHTIRLYCGFYQTSKEKGMEELIEFEEKIDDAMYDKYTLNNTCLNTTSQRSANDEGIYYPVYFMVMEVEILHRRFA
jgi:hypothetical protein